MQSYYFFIIHFYVKKTEERKESRKHIVLVEIKRPLLYRDVTLEFEP